MIALMGTCVSSSVPMYICFYKWANPMFKFQWDKDVRSGRFHFVRLDDTSARHLYQAINEQIRKLRFELKI